MTTSISDTFGLQLRQMRTDLIAQLRAQRGGKLGRAEVAPNQHDDQSGDRSQLDAERDVVMALDERETAQLNAIDAALQRIANGEYGICADCGVNIPSARLHASPATLRCVACQGVAEQAHGGQAHPSM